MANKPMWKTFGHNDVCSIRRCGAKPTKRLDLAVIGTRKFGSFGREKPWKEAVGTVPIVVCERCFKMIHEKNPEAIERLYPTEGFAKYLKEFAHKVVAHFKGKEDQDGN